jgi:hypothetical protein
MSERSRLLLRAAAVVLLVGAAALFVVVARAERDADVVSTVPIAQSAILLLICIAAAAALWALSLTAGAAHGSGSTITETLPAPVDSAALARLQQDISGMFLRVDELAVLIERVCRDLRSASSRPGEGAKDKSIDRAVVDRLEQSLDEIRELAMLTERERQIRLDEARRERLANRIKLLLRMIDQCQWAQADGLLAELNRLAPEHEDVKGAAKQLENSRRRLQNQAVDAETARIELDMSAGAWDEAMERAQKLVADYPGSERASALLSRVHREHGAWQTTAAQSMFESLRQDIEHRYWRRASETARRMLEQFPDHPHADLVGRQIKLIQDNAEIEQRQEQEIRIRELIRNRQFSEAIQQAEDLLARFPNSPQADAIDLLLPRIRELALAADQEEAQTSSGAGQS